MSLMEDLVRRSLGDVTAGVKRQLIRELEGIGKQFVVSTVADSVSRTVIKSLDGVVAAAVKHLPAEPAERLAAAYLAEVLDQLDQFGHALMDYLPHQVAVEQAKKNSGSKSSQAIASRQVRQAFIDGVQGEVRDIFKAIAGQTVED